MKQAVLALLAVVAAGGVGQAAADGKAVYDKTCVGCHAAMPPKLGDKAAFKALKKDAATASVIKGKGAMPPKGGAVTDADAKAAVEYMFSMAK